MKYAVKSKKHHSVSFYSKRDLSVKVTQPETRLAWVFKLLTLHLGLED